MQLEEESPLAEEEGASGGDLGGGADAEQGGEMSAEGGEDTDRGIEADADMPTWAQCGKCGKWRALPCDARAPDLTEDWSCSDNPDGEFGCVTWQRRSGRRVTGWRRQRISQWRKRE